MNRFDTLSLGMIDDVGQIVCVGVPEEGLSHEFERFITKFRVGNFILFKRNTKSGPYALKALIGEIKGLLRKLKMPPPFICVDQEGGRVSRLGPPHWPKLPSFSSIGRADAPKDEIERVAAECAHMLTEVGINVNLAPCLDLAEDSANEVMKERCFSNDPNKVKKLGKAYIRALQRQGILAVAKHFPGIGSVDLDPHTSTSKACANPERQQEALLPFYGAVEAGVFGVMTSHVLVPCYDPEEIATFSEKIVKMLREGLGFEGILFTDDLFMGAVRANYGLGAAGARALAAGHDILLYCHDLLETENALTQLIKLMEEDDTLKRCVARSSRRIRGEKRRIYRSN